MPRTASRHAFAKVNLGLAVEPPEAAASTRAGWHRIGSIFHAIDLHDTVRVERLRGGRGSSLTRAWADDAPRATPIDWPEEADLAMRALRLFEGAIGGEAPVSIDVRKRIPAGGGLGGGSSDAAAVLMCLRALFAPDMPVAVLRERSASLGSDIAFFLDEHALGPHARPPRPALVTGFGDGIERVDDFAAGRGLTLVVPPFGCDTRAVYAAFDRLPAHGGVPAHERARAWLAKPFDPRALANDLEPAADAVSGGRLGEILTRSRELAGVPTRMTGSGSGVLVFSDDPALPGRLAEEMGVAALGVRLL